MFNRNYEYHHIGLDAMALPTDRQKRDFLSLIEWLSVNKKKVANSGLSLIWEKNVSGCICDQTRFPFYLIFFLCVRQEKKAIRSNHNLFNIHNFQCNFRWWRRQCDCVAYMISIIRLQIKIIVQRFVARRKRTNKLFILLYRWYFGTLWTVPFVRIYI